MLMMIKAFCLFVGILLTPKTVAHVLEHSTPKASVLFAWAAATTAFIVLQWMI